MATVIKRLIVTPKAPKPVAPYNQAVLADRTIYVSGILGLDPSTMQLVSGGVVEETKKALQSLGHILKSADSSYEKVIKVTLLLKNIDDFATVNEIYSTFFTKDFPARVAFQVGALPLDASIEIDAVAISGEVKVIEGGLDGCLTCGPAACTFFTKYHPARCAYQVAALPLKANIEIEAIALTGEVKIIDGNKEACTTCGKL